MASLLGTAVSRANLNLAVEIASANPQLAKDCAGKYLESEANKLNGQFPGLTKSQLKSQCLQVAMQKYPDLAVMQSNGSVTPEALREIFGQWFKS